MVEQKKKKPIKKIVSDVIFSLFMTFFGLVILFSILQKTVGFAVGGVRLVWVLSPSMEPTIPQQSYVAVRDCKAEDVQVNDIIMFISDDPKIKGKNNTHRVVEILANGEFVTKGDNNLTEDKYHVRPENVVAKYDRNLPFLTFFGRLYASPAGIVLTVGLIVGLIGAWFAIDINERKKASKQEYMDKLVKEEVARLEKERKSSDGKENK